MAQLAPHLLLERTARAACTAAGLQAASRAAGRRKKLFTESPQRRADERRHNKAARPGGIRGKQ